MPEVDPVDARELAKAAKFAATYTAKRDALILKMHAIGVGPRAIGRIAGMNHASVIYIVQREQRRKEQADGQQSVD